MPMSGKVLAVHEQDVGIAVIVIVDESATRAQGLREILFSKRSVVVSEMNAGGAGHIDKLNAVPGIAQQGRGACRQKNNYEHECDQGFERLEIHFAPPCAAAAG